ncbi:MAG: PAS domain S-box protein [Syntrophobacteraceae bacterium]|jgi:two-component system NtrC family sensor kinase
MPTEIQTLKIEDCRSDQFLASLIENSTDGIIVSDLRGNILLFNKGAERLFGYTAEEAVGKVNAAAFYPPGVAQDILRKMRDNRFGGKGKLSPHRLSGVSKSGELVPLSISGALIYEDGLEIASMGIFCDLRQILKAREELLAAEVKFRSLFETVGHGLYFSTMGGKFLDCNQALLDMLGYETKEELHAIDTLNDLFIDPAQRAEFWTVMERQGYLKEYEVKLRKRDGEAITVLVNAHAKKDRSGTVLVGYQVIIVDVTESRRLMQQLYQSDKLAAIGRLTAQIAHELNNPIYGVMNCLDLLKSEVPGHSKKRKFLDMAQSEIHRISQLLNSMLSYLRPVEDVRTNVDLNELVKDVVLFMGSQLQDAKVKTVLDLQEDLPQVCCSGNQIKQVLLNLVMNAKTAMAKAGGALTITSRAANGEVRLKIADTGVGIPPQIRGKLFEPFITTKNEITGTGLGLSVCFGIIRQHNGVIEVESEVAAGTTFTVILPIQPEQGEPKNQRISS